MFVTVKNVGNHFNVTLGQLKALKSVFLFLVFSAAFEGNF